MTPIPECPVCGAYVQRSHECAGSRARKPWVNRPDDFAARVEHARRIAGVEQLGLALDVDRDDQ